MLNLLSSIIRAFDVQSIAEANSTRRARKIVSEAQLDCVFMDLARQTSAPLDLLNFIRRSGEVNNPAVPVILARDTLN